MAKNLLHTIEAAENRNAKALEPGGNGDYHRMSELEENRIMRAAQTHALVAIAEKLEDLRRVLQ